MSDAQLANSKFQRRATGTDTVTVACSLPTGHILQIYDIEESEQVLPNGRTFKENIATVNLEHGQWHLNGAALDYGALAGGNVPDYRVIKGSAPGTGYGLTMGVPRDFWEAWLKQNATSPLVKNRLIFAASTEDAAVGEARDYKDLRSGLQGLDQKGDYRVPSGRNIRKYSPNDNRVTPDQRDLAEAAE
jgi:hypothetical protein